MKIVKALLILSAIPLLLSSCLQKPESNHISVTTLPVDISIEEAQTKVPFEIKQPLIPFQTTQETARILNADGKFDAVEITYESTAEGLNLVIMINNSKVDKPSKGEKGLKLINGSQTWEQEDEHVRAVFWRHEELNYTLISVRDNDGNFVPLYDFQQLTDIANTIK